MGAKHSDRLGTPKSSHREKGGGRRAVANRGCIAAAALSVLSATLANAKPPNVSKPVDSPHNGVAANVGNSLVVHPPSGGTSAQTHGRSGAGEPILKTPAPTAFGFVKPTAHLKAADAKASAGAAISPAASAGTGAATQRLVKNGSTLAIVSTPVKHATAAATSAPDVVLDNTLGQFQTATGPAYALTASQGALKGTNIFFSFSQFSLATGESATFSGPSSVKDVFVRVTGNSSSTIDGKISCTIPNADFFFMNPAGVTFTANANLDLQGSLLVSTANSIALGSTGSFNATTPSASMLTADAPSVLSFTVASPASTAFTGAQLSVPAGSTLAIAAGPVQFTGATLNASAGRISIASVSAAGQVEIDPPTLDLTISAPSLPLGPVSLTANSLLSADGPAGGAIHIVAGSLAMNGSGIRSTTTGAGTGAASNIDLAGPLTLTDSGIRADSTGAGNAGSIMVSADSLTQQGTAIIGSSNQGSGNGGNVTVSVSGAASLTGSFGLILTESLFQGGNAGNISFSAGSLTLQSDARIVSYTYGLGNSGNVNVTVAGSALITGSGSQIDAETEPSNDANTNSGNIMFSAGSLTLQAGGQINTSTTGPGKGGDITAHVSGAALITGADSGVFSKSTTIGPASTNTIIVDPVRVGDAGNITFSAGSLTMQAGGQINSSTGEGTISIGGTGNGGNVTVKVTGDALITDAGSGIFSSSESQGLNAGGITVTASSLSLLGGAMVSSSTGGPGNGGNVTVAVSGRSLITGSASAHTDSGIYADSDTNGSGGNAGDITYSTGSLTLQAGGRVSSSTFDAGKGGNVSVTVSGAALIEGQDFQQSGAESLHSDSGIYATSSVASQGGDAGNISFAAGSLTLQAGGQVSSSTYDQGNGGNVTVDVSREAVISGPDFSGSPSGIFASAISSGQSGNAGSVTVFAATLLVENHAEVGSSVVTSITVPFLPPTDDQGVGGNVHINGGTIRLLNGAQINASSESAGAAGSIYVMARGNILLEQASNISVYATQAKAGDIYVNTPAEIELFDGSQITASAHQSGGDIYFGYNPPTATPAVARQTTGVQPGIPIGLVVLDDSFLVATAQAANGGLIQVNSDALLQASSSLISAATANRQAIQGVVVETNPSQDLSGQLAVLPNVLLSLDTTLQDICAQRLGGNFSSFIVTGQGGLPLEAGGWLPTLMFDTPLDMSLDSPKRKKAQATPQGAALPAEAELGCCGRSFELVPSRSR